MAKNEKNKKSNSEFKAHCFHCKEKEQITLESGMNYELPYAYVGVPKDKQMLKEFKEYAKESEIKYKDARVIKRALLNYCPKCGHTVNVCCKDYIDFYSPKKENKSE